MAAWAKASAGLWLLCAPAVTVLPAEPLPLRHYSTSNGLVHNRVSALYSDSRGFLWICTDEGLARFDGRQFKTYTRQNGIPHIHVNGIVETRDGEYWIATDGGVARFHPRNPGKQFESFALGSAPEAQFVNGLAEDRDGSLLAGTNGGLFRIARGKSVQIEPLPVRADRYPGAPAITRIRVDSSGRLWVGTEDGLLLRTRHRDWVRLPLKLGPFPEFIEDIAFDAQGRPWAGTKHGAVRLRPDPDGPGARIDLVLTERDGLPDPDVIAIWFSSVGRAWFGTMNGLAEWDPQRGRALRSYHRGDGLTDPSIYAITEDIAGNLWFGTRRGGALELLQLQIQTYGAAAGLVTSGDDVVLETAAGEICVAAIGDTQRPVECLEAGRFARAFPKLPPSVTAWSTTSSQATLADRTGAWWISTGRGLFRFPPGPTGRLLPNRSFDLRLFPGSMWARRLFEDRAGNIWIETRQGDLSGLAKWDARQRRIVELSTRLSDKARASAITAFADDGECIWLGLGRPGGLLRLRGETVEEIPDIPPGTVNALHCDRRGHIWLASADAGLAEVDASGARPVVRVYDAPSHLSSNEVWCITEDRLGRVYAGTARGVDRIEPRGGAVLHYSVADGLAEGDIRSALCDRNGDLWFLSNQGLSRLHSIVERPLPPPIPRITELRAGGKLELLSEFGETQAGPLRLEPEQSSVEIDFLAVSHRAPSRLRYQYRLSGAGADWSEPSANSSVGFPHLAPGKYRFELRTLDEEGRPGPAAASVAFAVLAPVWNRWWFQALILLAGAGLLYGWYHVNTAQQVALERVRTRIAMDLHDEMGAGLSRIAVLSEALGHSSPPPVKAQQYVQEISETSRSLAESTRDLVWTITPGHRTLRDLLARIRAFGEDLLAGTTWDVTADGTWLARELTVDQRRHLYLILKEAVHNIARHARAARASLRVWMEGGLLVARVEDDGCGFPDREAAGLGLDNMRRRAVLLGAQLSIESHPGKGTCIEVRVPMKP